MPLETWLPIDYAMPDGTRLRQGAYEGEDWQIYKTLHNGRALVVKTYLLNKWVESELISGGLFQPVHFAGEDYHFIACDKGQRIEPVAENNSPSDKNEALAFADALRSSRESDQETPLHDALYVEKISRLLPTFSLSPSVQDDVLLGSWLSGGVPVSAIATRRMNLLLSWLGEENLQEVVLRAGFTKEDFQKGEIHQKKDEAKSPSKLDRSQGFKLAGRPELEAFINEHVVDIVENQETYKALGINFPSAIVLHGPPGCGKTYAIEQLVEYLAWPCFKIEASSVASPYIHETSKKVAEVFEQAMQNSPSVLMIDEMEAFLADRQAGAGSGHHRVEEVAEFLRRIPEANANHVLVVAMTNRIEMVDPAILRRGRFDHVIKVDMASEEEVFSLVQKLLDELPKADNIEIQPLAKELKGRPLSDVAFVVREAARLAARAGEDKLTQESLVQAVYKSPSRTEEKKPQSKIGF